tara:strand:- start:745 stop:1176 length:432 start_codon:yes stop_codon:yes gene_type:complete
MNKIKQTLLDKLPTIFVVLTFLFGMTLIFNHAKAEHDHNEQKEPFYLDLIPRNVPLFCGSTGYVFQTAFELFGEKMMSGAKVRENAKPEGKVIGVLSFTYNENTNTGTFMMTIPETGETCILAYGVEWEFYKDILVEGNASKQ